MGYVADFYLRKKGILTLEPECMATGSTFTLLTRDLNTSLLLDFKGLNLVIPKVNQTLNKHENDLIETYIKNNTILAVDPIIHPTSQSMNDLNVASVRVS